MQNTDEDTQAQLLKLSVGLMGTEISCWGFGQEKKSAFRKHYYGTISGVDPKDPLHLMIKDGNISEIHLHFRPGDHMVTLDEPAVEGGNTADFVVAVACGFDFEAEKHVWLLDYMKEIVNRNPSPKKTEADHNPICGTVGP